jgi:hypothetical protein
MDITIRKHTIPPGESLRSRRPPRRCADARWACGGKVMMACGESETVRLPAEHGHPRHEDTDAPACRADRDLLSPLANRAGARTPLGSDARSAAGGNERNTLSKQSPSALARMLMPRGRPSTPIQTTRYLRSFGQCQLLGCSWQTCRPLKSENTEYRAKDFAEIVHTQSLATVPAIPTLTLLIASDRAFQSSRA